jgi:uncharacterized protein (TIGR02145 family)
MSTFTVSSQSLPVLRIYRTDTSISTTPLREIDSLVPGTVTVSSQSLPVLRMYNSDSSISVIPLNEIDSLVHEEILPVNIQLLDVKKIANNSALLESRILSKGGGTLGKFGFCWSTSSNPMYDPIYSALCESTDSINFSKGIFHLDKNTTYFVRAFAFNESGISYSNQVEFITLNKPDTVLETVKIGSQFWTSKNLDVSTYRNGDPIRYVSTSADWQDAANKKEGAWCYYNNDSSNAKKYGKLYNWYAVIDPRGLAPLGYHIPSDDEWSELTTYLGGEDIAGFKMRSTEGWYDGGNGDNSSGFNGQPGGSFYIPGNGVSWFCYSGASQGGIWWSTSTKYFRMPPPGPSEVLLVLMRDLRYYDSKVNKYGNYMHNGNSVRCVRD